MADSRLTFKYRLYPSKSQSAFLEHQLREACDLYNCALQERRDAWKTCRKSISYYDQQKQLTAIRAEGLIGLVNAQCAQDVLRRLDKTFQAFFARVKCGAKPGFPRYKSARRYDSITFPFYGNGCRLRGGKLYIQGAELVKIKLHRPLIGNIKTVTIKREAGRWYACFSIQITAVPLPLSAEAVGIDVGLSSFAALSDGTEIPNPRHARKAEARMRRAQRKVARRKKGSNRRRKAVRELQRSHAHVRNQCADFHHKMSRQLVNSYGLIAVEDLNIKGLIAGMLAKSVRDAGWSAFLEKLSYKAASAGRELVKVDPRGTSQICVCGMSVPKSLWDRWHNCICGVSGSRDVVSAQVILQRARIEPSRPNVGVVMPSVPREAVSFR